MKILKKILEIFLNIIIGIIVILLIIISTYAIQTKIFKNNNANIFGYTFFEVTTGSMSGTIEIGDLVIVKITNDVKENEIIVYESGNHYITHRISQIRGNQIITKGDANNTNDMPIKKEQVLGRVVQVIPKVGILKKILKDPFILIGIIILIIVLIALIYYKPYGER